MFVFHNRQLDAMGSIGPDRLVRGGLGQLSGRVPEGGSGAVGDATGAFFISVEFTQSATGLGSRYPRSAKRTAKPLPGEDLIRRMKMQDLVVMCLLLPEPHSVVWSGCHV